MIDILRSSKFLLPTLLITSIYTILIIYLMNSRLVLNTVTGVFPLEYKFKLLFALLNGMWTAMSGSGLIILITTAFLTGANWTLVIQKVAALRSFGSVHLVVSGSSLLGIVGSGCAACSLPIISLLGLSGSLIYLPLRGQELSYISVVLLAISFYFLLRSIDKEKYCQINPKR